MNTKHTRSFHMALLMAAATATCLVGLSRPSVAILVQPYNYLLDDSAMVGAPDASASLSPYLNEQHEASADKDIAGIIGDSLARLRWARMLDGQQSAAANQQAADEAGHLSQEMAELIRSEQDQQAKQEGGPDQQTLSSSVASMILNVAQAAAAAASSGSVDEAHQPQGESPLQADQQASSSSSSSSSGAQPSHLMSSRGSIMELDTSAGSPSAASMASKADLKVGPTQWFNPKETIPVLKISAMATPSKYKKVYFRSEKKLVDGAFHSPAGEHTGHGEAKKQPLVKAFQSSGANVQRRSSRGTSSSVPPSILQDGVIDFLRKFRDVYVQTRPAGSAQSSSSAASNVASMVAAAASSPFASIMSPSGGSGGSRPNLASALSAASSMMNSAAMLSQAASSSVPASSSSSSLAASTSGASSAGAATGASGAAAGSPAKSPLTPQSYVSFWSKTFPTWVRKMLKQMRRRSLHNSSKRQQHQHHHHHGGHQKIASGAVSSVVDSSSGSSSSSSSSSSGSSSSSSSSR